MNTATTTTIGGGGGGSATATTTTAGAGGISSNNTNTTTATTTATITRPIHPCVMNMTKYNRSIEFVTMANLFIIMNENDVVSRNDSSSSSSTTTMTTTRNTLPNIVTASSNTLCIYTICPNTKQLILYDHYCLKSILSHLAGTIISLSTIPISSSSSAPDALLLGFGGHPRCVVLTLVPVSSSSSSSSIQQEVEDEGIGLYEWQVVTMIDMSHIMFEYSLGATTIYEQDMIISTTSSFLPLLNNNNTTKSTSSITSSSSTSSSNNTSTTACCILGGGIAIAMITFHYQPALQQQSQSKSKIQQQMIITADEPYIVPLAYLNIHPYHTQYNGMLSMSSSNDHHNNPNHQQYNHGMIHHKPQTSYQDPSGGSGDNDNNNNNDTTDATTMNVINRSLMGSTIPTGFGNILDVLFLHGYVGEPVIVLLHTQSTNGGITSMGRIMKHNTTSTTTTTATATKAYYYCTALSISTIHQRTAILWSIPLPSYIYDALYLTIPPPPPLVTTTKSTHHHNCFVLVANNTITFINSMDGTIQQSIAMNGWAGATTSMGNKNSDATTTTTAAAAATSHRNHPNNKLSCNPIMKLSIQLDGCTISWISNTVAIILLRYGQMYLLQQYNTSSSSSWNSSSNTNYTDNVWYIIPLQYQCTSIGEVATASNMVLWMSPSLNSNNNLALNEGYILAGSRLGNSLWLQIILDSNVVVPKEIQKIFMNLYTKLHDNDEPKYTLTASKSSSENHTNGEHLVDDEYDEIIRIEDEALYDTSSTTRQQELPPDIVPPSDDDEDDIHNKTINGKKQEGTNNGTMMVVRSITPIDCIVNVGPLGPSCSGPIDRVPPFLLLQNNPNTDDDDDVLMEDNATNDNTDKQINIKSASNSSDENTIYGSVADIYPSGYGSSGGIAYMTVPGRDDRTMISETDCLYTDCIFTLSHHGIVLLGMSNKNGGPGGIRILQQQVSPLSTHSTGIKQKNIGEMKEIYIEEWCCSESIGVGNTNFVDSWEIFQSTLLCAGEYNQGRYVILIVKARDSIETSVVIMKRSNTAMEIIRHHRIDLPKDHPKTLTSSIIKVSPITSSAINNDNFATFGCVWSSGDATLVNIDAEGNIVGTCILGCDPTVQQIVKDEMEVDYDDNDDDEAKEIEKFYNDKSIIAVDVFQVPVSVFECFESLSPTKEWANEVKGNIVVPELTTSLTTNVSDNGIVPEEKWNVSFDAEDEELYSRKVQTKILAAPIREVASTPLFRGNTLGGMGTYFAVYRKSGSIDIYSVSAPRDRIWTIYGASLGLPFLTAVCKNVDGPTETLPRSHCIAIEEIRFFTCGPAMMHEIHQPVQNICLSMVTSEGDMSLYTLITTTSSSNKRVFRRIPLRSVGRVSQEQVKHHGKLSRKGYISKDSTSFPASSLEPKFIYNIMYRFYDISGQNGLFAALARPQWLVCERGQIVALDHRLRHAAPAGGAVRPISSFSPFCFKISSGNSDDTSLLSTEGFGYITLHERVGRVGSQRLTLYKELSNVFESQGILLGNGCCMEKVLLGVTVRRIIFIDDETISTGDHPLYALLVSREVEVDQSELNTDGLSDSERLQKEQEREAIKIQKQVEADLYGFDMESEWVEYIERENAFPIQNELGGAPPIHQSIYSLWIVDAARKWMVIDSYELDEYEHGIDLKIMYLTEFQDDTGGTTMGNSDPTSSDSPKRLFIALGTGIVNHDGEDVNTKGRVLLFDIKRTKPTASGMNLSSTAPYAELSLVHEKNIFHGPVTSLSCLVSDHGKHRLVIGAGSDINIEMWNQPQNKLIQVGFFRATMHILEVIHFKNFLLLSDAYDSIHLLVFRESDKSLTLLAKDYDPIPVYATGIMTRGSAMTFVCHDDRQNLQFFQYAPGEAAARGGNKLVCRADFHLGKQTTHFRTHYCRPSLLIHSATPASTLSALKQQDPLFGRQDDDQRIGVNCGTSDGNIISIIPLSEPVYWRLMALQSVMSNALESDCVLNHRAWRLYRRSIRRGGCRNNDRKKGVIDGDLIMKYPDLPITVQEDLASAIGSTVELILDNLLEAQCASMTI